ncbi:hypothetical protein PIB30_097591 [Stylosanthes scabra]|uniref:Uncharacterized protein n=1 Tax=Stylosanthes scabra TaxID=79078 RepID=A0ABU6WXA1_9FABA|nr:hypothetical protein [Stylosanthes scabra]
MRTNVEKGRPLFHGFLKSAYGASSSSQVDPMECFITWQMECFITWQLERENSGLFDRKPIINSLLNKTNEPKKKNGERKLEEQERRNLENFARAPTPRRGDSRLSVQSSSPGFSHPRLGIPSPPQGQAIHA